MESSIRTENDTAIQKAVKRELADFGHVPGEVGEVLVRQTVTVKDIAKYRQPQPDMIAADSRWRETGIDYS